MKAQRRNYNGDTKVATVSIVSAQGSLLKECVLDDTGDWSSTSRTPTHAKRGVNDGVTMTLPTMFRESNGEYRAIFPSSDSGGMSVGEQAGIGFGVGSVFLGICVAIFLLIRRERRRGSIEGPAQNADTYDKPQLDSREVNSVGGSTQTPGTAHPQFAVSNPGELHGTTARQEFDGTPARYELPP